MPITNYSPSKGIQVTELEVIDMKYVDRGDPATPDFGLVDLIIDNAFHPLDLSAIVPPAGANHLVHLAVLGTDVSGNRTIELKNTEIVNDYNRVTIATQVANVPKWISCWVMLDADRKIKYKIEGIPDYWHDVMFTVRGWWID